MNSRPLYHRNRLYRSRYSRAIMGVCGGIAEHFDLAPWGVRLLFVLLLFVAFPIALIAYFVLGLSLRKAPPRPFEDYEEEEFWNAFHASRSTALRKIHRQFQMLDKRLQRMESIVTSPGFGMEDEFRSL